MNTLEKDLEPRTKRGVETKAKLVAAAEKVFAELGYHDASVVKITEAAGVGSGTFYLYFEGKQAIFEELVSDLNRRVRRAMGDASIHAKTRMDAEKAGFRAFFRFTAEHPALYRIIRQAEFVAPESLRMHYTKIVEGYISGLTQAQEQGEISQIDPEVAAWALMGIGELIGMRWVLWEQDQNQHKGEFSVPETVLDQMMLLISRGLAPIEGKTP
ncbi:MAG: TetR/AcrR family transcriptional regulator [Microbacteriaceae bacterium]